MSEAQNNIETPNVNPSDSIASKIYPASENAEVKPNPEATPEVKPEAPPAESKALEAKPEDEKPAEANPEAEDLKEVTLPKDSMLGKNDLDAVLSYAKEHGLTNKQAQALIEKQNEQFNSFIQSQVEAYQAKVAGFEDTIKSDKEIGGANYNKSVSLAKRVIEQFGTPDLKKEFDMSGYGSHPEVVRLLSRIGSAIGDDSLVMPTAKPAKEMSLAERIYGKQ